MVVTRSPSTAAESGGVLGGELGGDPVNGGTLRFLSPGGLDHLDTATAYDAPSGQVLRALTRQLFAYPAAADLSDPVAPFTPTPDVAVAVPTVANGGLSADHCVYTIRLRQGVYWDTAPPRAVTAADFVRGLKRLANPVASPAARHYVTSTILGMAEYRAAYAAAFGETTPTAAALAHFQETHHIAGVQAVDERTLVITLRRPANDFLNILAMGFASAVPVEYDRYLPDSPELRVNFISNGPYRLAHDAPQAEELRLERNPAWHQESDPIRRQYVEAIHITVAKLPPDVLRQKIDAGEVDLAPSFTDVSWAQPDPTREAFSRNYPGFALNPYLVFNLQSPNASRAVQHRQVRQAIAYAIDKVAISEILDVLEAVPNAPLHSVISPGNVGHRPFNFYPTPGARGNPAMARALLTEAGYGEGVQLRAAVRDVTLRRNVLASVARDLARCGIHLEMTTYGQTEYFGTLLSDPTKARAGVWDIAESEWTPDWFGNNGRAVVQPLFQSNCQPGTTNYGCYSSQVVDRLIAQALEEPDSARAAELWHTVDRRIMHDLPIVPLLACAAMPSRYHSSRVKNAIPVPQIGFFDITNLWLDPAD